MLIYRPYQSEGIARAVAFLRANRNGRTIQIYPTGAGKSVVIAGIAADLKGKKILVLQPTKEILAQNFKKYISYGYRAGIYSVSAGVQFVDDVTFATIGSIINKLHLFSKFDYLIIDECHYVGEDTQYKTLIDKLNIPTLGLTATPYRLYSNRDFSELQWLSGPKRIFTSVNYYVQTGILFEMGHLAKLEYFSYNELNRGLLQLNSNGTGFTEQSIKSAYRRIHMPSRLIHYANRLLLKRQNLLVRVSLKEAAIEVAAGIPGAVVLTDDTPTVERDAIVKGFRSGRIRCVVQVGILGIGFDFPGLEAALDGAPTVSLSKYYQFVGRIMRQFEGKASAWYVDLTGNFELFGRIETMRIDRIAGEKFCISNMGVRLTNVPFRAA